MGSPHFSVSSVPSGSSVSPGIFVSPGSNWFSSSDVLSSGIEVDSSSGSRLSQSSASLACTLSSEFSSFGRRSAISLNSRSTDSVFADYLLFFFFFVASASPELQATIPSDIVMTRSAAVILLLALCFHTLLPSFFIPQIPPSSLNVVFPRVFLRFCPLASCSSTHNRRHIFKFCFGLLRYHETFSSFQNKQEIAPDLLQPKFLESLWFQVLLPMRKSMSCRTKSNRDPRKLPFTPYFFGYFPAL